MKNETELPAEVIAAIQENRKLSAIKLLRAQRGIGLKKAKELVDAYELSHPVNTALEAPESDTGIGRIFVLIIGVSVIYAIYKYFS